MKRLASTGLILLTFIALLFSEGANAALVFVKGSQEGRGISRMRGDECFVLTPFHVLKIELPGGPPSVQDAIEVIGPSGASSPATFVRDYGDDLAILRIERNHDRLCADEIPEVIKGKSDPYIVYREPDGALKYVPVDVHTQDDRAIWIKTDESDLMKRMSGSSLFIKGNQAGMLMRGSEYDGRFEVTTMQYITALIGSWLAPVVADLDIIEKAQSIIMQAASTKPLSDSGQVKALETLLRGGRTLEGFDLSGIYLGGGTYDRGSFKEANLVGVSFAGASGESTDFSKANLSFSNFNPAKNKAKFAQSKFQSAALAFIDFRDADFQGTVAQQSNWFASNGQGANFSGAQLQNASFQFADLRDAIFDRADLTGAFFTGALLEGASFQGAIINNTDFTAAVVGEGVLTSEQLKGACRTLPTREDGFFNIALIEKTPSSRFKEGYAYESFYEDFLYFPWARHTSLRICKPREQLPRGRVPAFMHKGLTYLSDAFGMSISNALLEKANRKAHYRTRAETHLKFIRNELKQSGFLKGQNEPSGDLIGKTMVTNEIRPSEPVWLYSDTLMLLLLRNYPDLFAQLDKSELARQRLRMEISEKGKQGWQLYDAWDHFFPEGIYPEQLTGPLLESFWNWTVTRAEKLPSTITLRLHGPIMPRHARTGQSETNWKIFQASPDTADGVASGGVWSSGYSNSFAKMGVAAEHMVFLDLRSHYYGLNGSALALPRPTDSYVFTPSSEILEKQETWRLKTEVDFDVLATRILKSDHGRGQGVVIAVLPTALRVTEDGKPLWSREMAERLQGSAIQKLINGKTVSATTVTSGDKWIERYGHDNILRYLAEGEESVGQWSIEGDRLCRRHKAEAGLICEAVYRDGEDLWLTPTLDSPNVAFHRIEKITEEELKSPDLHGASTLDVFGVRLGMPLSQAHEIISNRLGRGFMSHTIRTTRQYQKLLFEGTVFSNTDQSDRVSVFVYPTDDEPRVAGVIRELQVPDLAETKDDIVRKLEEKYGKPKANKKSSDRIAMYWADGYEAKLSRFGSSPCFDAWHTQSVHFSGDGKEKWVFAPVFHSIPNKDTSECGPTVGAELRPRSKKVEVWLLDTLRASIVQRKMSQKEASENKKSKVSFENPH